MNEGFAYFPGAGGGEFEQDWSPQARQGYHHQDQEGHRKAGKGKGML